MDSATSQQLALDQQAADGKAAANSSASKSSVAAPAALPDWVRLQKALGVESETRL